jgi:hypothetical protein
MKELSIEEKAKAYDEALEKAKIWQEHLYDVNDKDYADELNYIFPELKESEDERVRNKLIEFFKGYFPDEEWWGNITQEDIIAYLEKQGEQKPAEWSEEDEKISSAIIKRLSGSDALSVSLSSAISWVGNIKDRVQLQNQWKPSDRQINVLEYYMYNLVCNEHKEILFGLYTDLKKLRER